MSDTFLYQSQFLLPMTQDNPLQATYSIHDFYAVEFFDDPKFNKKPHVTSRPDMNGHSADSIGSIDDSLQGATVKDAVDFLADHNGHYRKEHSKITAIDVEYIQDGVSIIGYLPVTMIIPFKSYILLGRPEKVNLTLSASE
tara:strand:+ start:13996 stop:14418 length:423 start_codon:yes stop_codon:yes gene_type:complete